MIIMNIMIILYCLYTLSLRALWEIKIYKATKIYLDMLANQPNTNFVKPN